MKYMTAEGWVATIQGDRIFAIKCNTASLGLRDKAQKSTGVFLLDLDSRVQEKPRLQTDDNLERSKLDWRRRNIHSSTKTYFTR
ncbi:hypothetical protein AHAS_Ahas16G0135500 [Arachis hypogaea]